MELLYLDEFRDPIEFFDRIKEFVILNHQKRRQFFLVDLRERPCLEATRVPGLALTSTMIPPSTEITLPCGFKVGRGFFRLVITMKGKKIVVFSFRISQLALTTDYITSQFENIQNRISTLHSLFDGIPRSSCARFLGSIDTNHLLLDSIRILKRVLRFPATNRPLHEYIEHLKHIRKLCKTNSWTFRPGLTGHFLCRDPESLRFSVRFYRYHFRKLYDPDGLSSDEIRYLKKAKTFYFNLNIKEDVLFLSKILGDLSQVEKSIIKQKLR